MNSAPEQEAGTPSARSPRPVCLVTGGGGDLGSAVCHALAEAGNHVIVVDMAGPRADKVVSALTARGYSASSATCNVGDSEEVDRLAREVLEQFGPVSVLVNMAGAVRNDVVAKISDEDFDVTFKSHVKGTLATMRAFIPAMKQQKYGRIINTSSIAARGAIGGGSYSASKAAIEGLSRAAALEVAHHNITVNCIAPGLIAAGMFLTTPEEFRNKSLEQVPMRRAGTPDDVAPCVAFLASDGARYLTGQTITICGGLTVGY